MQNEKKKMKPLTRAFLIVFGWVALLVLFLWADTFCGAQSNILPASKAQQINTEYYVGSVPGWYPSIQSAVTKTCTTSGARVVIPAAAAPSDTIAAVTGGCAQASILDRNAVPEQPYTWNGSHYVAVPYGGGSAAGGNFAVQYDNNGVLGGVNFTGLVKNNGTASPPSSLTGSSTVTAVQGAGASGIAGTCGAFAANNLRATDGNGCEIDANMAVEGGGGVASNGLANANIDLTHGFSPTSSSGILFWDLTGGDQVHFGRPSGNNATGFYRNSPSMGNMLIADDSIPANFTNIGLLATMGRLGNGIGLQISSGALCAAGPGAICNILVPILTAEPDTSYVVMGCLANNASTGTPIALNTFDFNTSSFQVSIFNASTTSSTAGGRVDCIVMHP
jgi:hypothetical protein